jgi:ketosteroid isomerase-like protein
MASAAPSRWEEADEAAGFAALERDWAEAIRLRDREANQRLVADDFFLSSAIWRDRRIGKRPWIEQILAEVETESITVDDVHSQVFGDYGVVCCRVAWRARWRGEDISDEYFVTDVWRRRNGDWQVLWRGSSRRSGGPQHELGRG